MIPISRDLTSPILVLLLTPFPNTEEAGSQEQGVVVSLADRIGSVCIVGIRGARRALVVLFPETLFFVYSPVANVTCTYAAAVQRKFRSRIFHFSGAERSWDKEKRGRILFVEANNKHGTTNVCFMECSELRVIFHQLHGL